MQRLVELHFDLYVSNYYCPIDVLIHASRFLLIAMVFDSKVYL